MESKQLLRNYSPPLVLDHKMIKFATAHSWNKGHGNRLHPGNGNGGCNYQNQPWPGPQNGQDKGKSTWKNVG